MLKLIMTSDKAILYTHQSWSNSFYNSGNSIVKHQVTQKQ